MAFNRPGLLAAAMALAAAAPLSALATNASEEFDAWAAEARAEPCMNGDVPATGLVTPRNALPEQT